MKIQFLFAQIVLLEQTVQDLSESRVISMDIKQMNKN